MKKMLVLAFASLFIFSSFQACEPSGLKGWGNDFNAGLHDGYSLTPKSENEYDESIIRACEEWELDCDCQVSNEYDSGEESNEYDSSEESNEDDSNGMFGEGIPGAWSGNLDTSDNDEEDENGEYIETDHFRNGDYDCGDGSSDEEVDCGDGSSDEEVDCGDGSSDEEVENYGDMLRNFGYKNGFFGKIGQQQLPLATPKKSKQLSGIGVNFFDGDSSAEEGHYQAKRRGNMLNPGFVGKQLFN